MEMIVIKPLKLTGNMHSKEREGQVKSWDLA
jgi:hypothetical protein